MKESNTIRYEQASQSCGRLASRRHGFRTGVIAEDAPDARHVQFAKAVHLRLGIDRNSRGADGFGQIRIAFLNHHAAFDAFGEFRDQAQSAADK